MNKDKENSLIEKGVSKANNEQNDDYDPYLETFTSVETKPKTELITNDIPIITQPITKIAQSKPVAQKFEFGYQIMLTNANEDGLMETFLNEVTAEDKPRSEPSDWFNFGLDEEKWRKILNHNILMHYEKQLMLESQNKIEQQSQQQQQIKQQLPNYTNDHMAQANHIQMLRQNMYMNQFQQMQMQMRNASFPNPMQNYFNNQINQQRQMYPMNSQVPTTGSSEDK